MDIINKQILLNNLELILLLLVLMMDKFFIGYFKDHKLKLLNNLIFHLNL